MQFNKHYELEGKHSSLSASKHSWVRYTPERMAEVILNERKKQEGTELHAIASAMIKKRIKANPHVKKAFNAFVNDAIGFKLHSEVVLQYSDNAFATSDAIGFRNGELRIHDLKTGDTKPSFEQLDIYAALFMLEYDIDPFKVNTIVQRLYQFDGFVEQIQDPAVIREIMDKIIELDDVINRVNKEYYSEDF